MWLSLCHVNALQFIEPSVDNHSLLLSAARKIPCRFYSTMKMFFGLKLSVWCLFCVFGRVCIFICGVSWALSLGQYGSLKSDGGVKALQLTPLPWCFWPPWALSNAALGPQQTFCPLYFNFCYGKKKQIQRNISSNIELFKILLI